VDSNFDLIYFAQFELRRSFHPEKRIICDHAAGGRAAVQGKKDALTNTSPFGTLATLWYFCNLIVRVPLSNRASVF
jgi:hypothetical protein